MAALVAAAAGAGGSADLNLGPNVSPAYSVQNPPPQVSVIVPRLAVGAKGIAQGHPWTDVQIRTISRAMNNQATLATINARLTQANDPYPEGHEGTNAANYLEQLLGMHFQPVHETERARIVALMGPQGSRPLSIAQAIVLEAMAVHYNPPVLSYRANTGDIEDRVEMMAMRILLPPFLAPAPDKGQSGKTDKLNTKVRQDMMIQEVIRKLNEVTDMQDSAIGNLPRVLIGRKRADPMGQSRYISVTAMVRVTDTVLALQDSGGFMPDPNDHFRMIRSSLRVRLAPEALRLITPILTLMRLIGPQGIQTRKIIHVLEAALNPHNDMFVGVDFHSLFPAYDSKSSKNVADSPFNRDTRTVGGPSAQKTAELSLGLDYDLILTDQDKGLQKCFHGPRQNECTIMANFLGITVPLSVMPIEPAEIARILPTSPTPGFFVADSTAQAPFAALLFHMNPAPAIQAVSEIRFRKMITDISGIGITAIRPNPPDHTAVFFVVTYHDRAALESFETAWGQDTEAKATLLSVITHDHLMALRLPSRVIEALPARVMEYHLDMLPPREDPPELTMVVARPTPTPSTQAAAGMATWNTGPVTGAAVPYVSMADQLYARKEAAERLAMAAAAAADPLEPTITWTGASSMPTFTPWNLSSIGSGTSQGYQMALLASTQAGSSSTSSSGGSTVTRDMGRGDNTLSSAQWLSPDMVQAGFRQLQHTSYRQDAQAAVTGMLVHQVSNLAVMQAYLESQMQADQNRRPRGRRDRRGEPRPDEGYGRGRGRGGRGRGGGW